MNKLKFVVCAPPYANHSAGIIILHELLDALIGLGHDAYIAFMTHANGEWTFHSPTSDAGFNPGLRKTVLSEYEHGLAVNDALDNGICIYPEVVVGNPLQAKRVARYFLYHDGGITGIKCGYQPQDFLIGFSPAYLDDAHAQLFKPIVDQSMRDVGAPPFSARSLNLTFFGKGRKYAECFLVEDSVELSKAWPTSKKELASLLRHTKYLYTWDRHSSINMDAVFCGARPVLLQNKQSLLDKVGKPEPTLLEGCFDNEKIKIKGEEDYDLKRDLYLSTMTESINTWDARVMAVVNQMKSHFHLAS